MIRRNLWGLIASLGLILTAFAYMGQASVRPTYAQAFSSSVAQPMTPADVAALIPPFADTIPPNETVGGAPGSSATIRRGDAAVPRITRATTVTTTTGGTFSGTWATPLPNPNPTIVMTPIAASTSIDCQLTAAPTSTTFQGRCWSAQTTLLNLSIITAGLTLNPVTNTAAGIQVQVIALPATQ